MNLIRYVIVLSFLMPFLAQGQFNNLKFENLDTAEGMSSSTCLTIFQDSEGFLWFGTIDGLNKYNGYEFEIYKSVLDDSTSISNNRINAIAEDQLGNLWIGTNNGLNCFNKKTNSFIRINLYQQLSLADNPRKFINDLLFDQMSNTLWVATNNGITKIALQDFADQDVNNLKFFYYLNDASNINSLDNNKVNVISRDRDNVIWAGTDGQNLNRYNPEQDNFERVFIQSNGSYELNHIPKMVFVDMDNDMWIGNDLSNLVLWNRRENSFEHISFVEEHIPIRDLYLDRNGFVWVSTDGYGLFVIEKEGFKVQRNLVNSFSDPFSLANNKPSIVREDQNGVFWIGSYDKGVSILDPSKYLFGHYYYQPGNPNGLSNKVVQSVLEDSSGRIWISAYNGGLNLFEEKELSFKHFGSGTESSPGLSSTKIMYTFESRDGNIWVCTLDGGLNRFDPNTLRFERFLRDDDDQNSIGQNSVWTGVEDDQGRLWLGLRTEGMSLFDRKTGKFHNYRNTSSNGIDLASNSVLCLFIDSRNRLLIGSSLGLNVVDLNKVDDAFPQEIKFPEIKEEGIEGNGINHITEDHEGNIWLGTDGGIYKLDTELKLNRLYSSRDGLPNDLVVGIEQDDDHNFWISTKSGLSMLDPKTDLFKNFNIHDGLQGTEYQSKSIEKTHDGRIIVGGINGFNIFHPGDIAVPASATIKPQITTFKINNKPVVMGDSLNGRVVLKKSLGDLEELTLRADENYVSFEFVALYLENPEQVQYAYKMHGLDDGFVNIGSNRSVNLSNLESGEYIFEVKASTDGQWDKAPSTQINIQILPPIWRTWWAYLLYGIFGVMIFWLIIRYYTLKVKESQQHELDQMKLEFFVNVSHEFRTPLTLILNPVDKILANVYDSEVIKSSATTIHRSARRLLHLVNQLLDYRKMDVGRLPLQLEQGNVVKFIEDIFTLFRGLAERKEIEYKFVADSKNIISLFDFDKVEKIITNLISNAIKFTNVGGRITIRVNKITENQSKSKFFFFKKEKLGNYVEIIVQDSGVGIDKEQLNNIFSRFHNRDFTTTGTGIGLNFAKALAEIHGGNISVESQYRKGTKFIVKLPLDIKAEPEVVENVQNEFLINSVKAVEYDMLIGNDMASPIQEQVNAVGDEKLPMVLIVEDNKELRVHLTKDLRRNYQIKEATNGEEGLEMVKKFYPDIIISDVMMPKMDGFEMCRLVKSEFETCHIPVILLTARSLGDDRIDGYNSGADGYLAKPFAINVLRARMSNLLDAKKRLRQRFSEIGGIFPASEVTTNNMDEIFLDKATKIILENVSNIDFKQKDLFEYMGIGRSQFYRKISSLTGNNPSYFIRTIRLRYASEMLQKNAYSIKEVTHMAGFNSTAYFSKTFRDLFDLTPTQFMEQASDTKALVEK